MPTSYTGQIQELERGLGFAKRLNEFVRGQTDVSVTVRFLTLTSNGSMSRGRWAKTLGKSINGYWIPKWNATGLWSVERFKLSQEIHVHMVVVIPVKFLQEYIHFTEMWRDQVGIVDDQEVLNLPKVSQYVTKPQDDAELLGDVEFFGEAWTPIIQPELFNTIGEDDGIPTA